MRRIFTRIAAAALILALILPLTGCGTPPRRSRIWYTYFDTVTTLIGYGSEKDFDRAAELAGQTLERYHRLCDIYHEYSGEPNARTLNLQAGKEPVAVAGELMDVLVFGRKVWEMTGGECNIAMGAVLSLWHDCRETALSGGDARLPEDGALRAAAEHCRIEDLILDEADGTAFLADGAMSLDLGAVAKGYAAEKAAQALEQAGFTGYALSVGGNVRTIGCKADGEPWVGGIQDPDGESESAYVLRLKLDSLSLVTSGVYQRFYEVAGIRYHHIISPETLYPKDEFLSVSILCRDSGLADALSTAVFNLPLDQGQKMIDGLPGVEACWILADGTIVCSPGWEPYIIP